MKKYQPKEIENKWQEIWSSSNAFKSSSNYTIPKKYIVPMLPYPSGDLHMGHMRNYTISDCIARYWRNKGYNVCHPMGWDSFGAPAEQAAIKNGIHPKDWTSQNINKMKSQLIKMGFSFDWDRELSTCEVDYWKWEQQIFIDMWKSGMIEKKSGIVNWDPVDNTVLSNDQVDINGRGWRSGAVVEKKEMVQYYFKTTMFKDEMLKDIDELMDIWPDIVTKQQSKFLDIGIENCGIITPYSDWCISRQRGFGNIIPMINCNTCGTIPNENIPITAPNGIEYNGIGNPLDQGNWMICKCPSCGNDAKMETDTMDTFVQSSWYFIRYISEINKDGFDINNIKYWMPIDTYIGGSEHAIQHILFSRYMWRVFKKIGYISSDMCKEPFSNIITQGMVKNNGRKMSKSYGNGVSPDEIVDKYGVDIIRTYVMFLGPVEIDVEWSEQNIIGIYRFFNRFWDGYQNINNIEYKKDEKKENEAIDRIKMLKNRIPQVYERTYKFNTIIAGCMEVHKYIFRQSNIEIIHDGYKIMIEALSPIAPHICSEIETK